MQTFYEVNFNMMHHHKYSLTELENMIPWEREIYTQLLSNHINEENEKIKLKNAEIKAKQRTRRR